MMCEFWGKDPGRDEWVERDGEEERFNIGTVRFIFATVQQVMLRK